MVDCSRLATYWYHSCCCFTPNAACLKNRSNIADMADPQCLWICDDYTYDRKISKKNAELISYHIVFICRILFTWVLHSLSGRIFCRVAIWLQTSSSVYRRAAAKLQDG